MLPPVELAGGLPPDPGTHWEYQSLGKLLATNCLRGNRSLPEIYLLAVLAYCARNAGLVTGPAITATYLKFSNSGCGERCNLHWPQRGDWAKTNVGAIASTNARVCMIVDLHRKATMCCL